MLSKISSMLDAVADSLEAKGLIKEAYEIDKIADLLEDIKKAPTNIRSKWVKDIYDNTGAVVSVGIENLEKLLKKYGLPLQDEPIFPSSVNTGDESKNITATKLSTFFVRNDNTIQILNDLVKKLGLKNIKANAWIGPSSKAHLDVSILSMQDAKKLALI
jgi:hypothetical protein